MATEFDGFEEDGQDIPQDFYEKLKEMKDRHDLRAVGNANIDLLRARHMVDMVRILPDDVKVVLRVGDVKLDIFQKPETVIRFLKEVALGIEKDIDELKKCGDD